MSPVAGNETIERDLERLRPALTGYCHRMLGSGFEAEDATQETLMRAWRRSDTLVEPAALKAWLFRIATNVCLDQIEGRERRARPVDFSDQGEADPATRAAERESLRLAFVAALQHLPARQRVVLVLREVLRWSAQEVADLLETSAASVNSALQRARATLDALALEDADAPARPGPATRTSGNCSSSTSRPSPSTTSTASSLPWSLTVLEPVASDGAGLAVAGVHNFLQPYLPQLFSGFGLPERRTDADLAVAFLTD